MIYLLIEYLRFFRVVSFYFFRFSVHLSAGFDPDSHILGITAFVFGLQGKWALIVIFTIRIFFSILKEKDILETTSGKTQSITFPIRLEAL